MIKVVSLCKRRKGMSREDFRSYWENNHSRIGEAVFAGRAVRYFRRYLTPMIHPSLSGDADDGAFDAIMELWFENQEAMAATFAMVKDTPIAAYVREDEKHLFDQEAIRMFIVEDQDEPETDLQALPCLDARQAEAFLGIA